MSRNAITDVAGVRVGHAVDERIGSGVTAIIFDDAATASGVVGGGAPGGRDTALLDPAATVARVDAFVLAGGSAFGLDAPGGVQAVLRARGRGFRVRDQRVPIVPGAILFDLANGGDKEWGCEPVFWRLGQSAAEAAGPDVACGSVGAGLGATTADVKGGIGTTSATTAGGFTVGALVAVNALGSALVGDGPQFWAAPWERDDEFGGLGFPVAPFSKRTLAPRLKSADPASTTLVAVATDANLSKAEVHRLARMADDGLARALRPTHAALDGDTVFAAATARAARQPSSVDLVEIGTVAADCVARAIARGIYHATALPFPGAQPSWRDLFARARPGGGGLARPHRHPT